MVRDGGVRSSIHTSHVVRKTRDSPVRRIKELAETEAGRLHKGGRACAAFPLFAPISS